MKSKTEELIEELKRESPTTRTVLERAPADKLAWRPHEKSMTLGQLAYHVAYLPKAIVDLASELVREPPQPPRPQPSSVDEITSTHDASVAEAIEKITSWGDDGLEAIWKITKGGRTLVEMSRYAVMRSVMLNHIYHHRGQLTVYLRLLDVPLPWIYGPTADENPFA